MKSREISVITGMTLGVYISIKYILPIIIPFLFGWFLALTGFVFAGKVYSYPVMKKMHLTKERIAAGVIFVLIGLLVLLMWVLCCAGRDGVFCVWDWIKKNETVYEVVLKCRDQAVIYLQSEQFIEGIKLTAEQMISVGAIVLTACLSGFFIVKEYEYYKNICLRYLVCRRGWNIVKELGKGCKEYLKAQIRIMSVVAGVCAAGFYLLGIPHFIAWGIFIGVLDTLPFLGVGMVLVPWIIYAWWNGQVMVSVGMTVLLLATIVLRQFLEPKWIGAKLGIRPLYVLASIYLGIVLYGGMGFLLGPLSALLLTGLIQEWRKNEL